MYNVTIKNLCKRFGTTSVLSDINLNISVGEFFFLLGPSGCGKTTLLRIIAGFEEPEQGQILFNDIDVTRFPPQKRNCSLVFQSYALWPHMNVFQNIAFGPENKNIPLAIIKERVQQVLKLVRMQGMEQRFPNQLSGGQQQRIAVARALVVEPQLLLFDEPLSNLDARLRAEMRIELLNLHQKTGITTIYVTHDQEEALSLASRIAFMNNGAIIQVGTPRELYESPQTVQTAQSLGNANIIPGTIKTCLNGIIDAETKFGTVRGYAPNEGTLHCGQKIVCFFRPEKLELGWQQHNKLSGILAGSLYAGDNYHLYIENESGERFRAEIPVHSHEPEIGTKIQMSIAAKNVRMMLK
jgi:ABC-type Fe3+/spermidine/putrescine transport system ATPase subunit